MSNADTHRELHDLFNGRDLDAMMKRLAARFAYTDRARGIALNSPEEFRGWLQEWVSAFDGRVTQPRYLDAGDASISMFVGTGTSIGPMGPFPATGKSASFALCEILTYDASGAVTGGEIYYDQLGLLAQLGHIELPA